MADEFDTNELSMLSVGEGRASRSRSRSSSRSRSDKRGRGSTSTSREARQRRRHDTSDSNLEETKEQAGEQKLYENYPIQFKLMYSSSKKRDKPKAMARALKDCETFVVDSWREGGLFHKTDGLPDELVKLTNWKPKAWDQLKSMLKEMMEVVILIDGKGQWSLQPEIVDEFTEGDAERFMKKYDELPIEAVYHCIQYRRALIVRPTLGNTSGRLALFNLCTMLCYLLPLPYKHRCYPVNVGGGAPTWEGNCKIGYMYCNSDLTDEELGDLLHKRVCFPAQQMRVCDLQIIDPLTNTSFWISGEIKTMEDISGIVKEWDARRQAWEQALPGLRYEDESYAILLTPTKAELFQLRLYPSQSESNKGRHMLTYTKTYNFISKEEEKVHRFATDEFEKLMVDIMGIMFRGSKNIRNRYKPNEAGGSSSQN